MAILRPFCGWRPLPEFVAEVAAKPYDVLSSDEARKEAEGHPLSFLHVGKPEIDLDPTINIYDIRVYEKAKENLERFLTKGIFRKDPEPYLYIYSQTMNNHTQYGIVGCVSVQEYLNDKIKKHELTRKDKEDDRTKHILYTNAHTGPIFLTYKASSSVDEIVSKIIQQKPVYDFIASDGVVHKFWVISNRKDVNDLVEIFKSIPALYVADGHHRSASAVRVAQEMMKKNPNHTGEEEYNYFLAVCFPHNQLKILDYNRVVKDLNGRTKEEFLNELKENFEVRKLEQKMKPAGKGEFTMYLEGDWYHLCVSKNLKVGEDLISKLDVSILQNYVLDLILGIKDPRTDKRIDFVGGIRGLEELERRVNSGEMKVAFALYPTSIEELIAVADAGKIMPPKSTWFEPKLRDGLVIHMIE
ncbi:MAG: hypothetical protein IGBAC_1451 [Ignavibacteriae bacterium]|nr:MAG: hypothetical protein IGBAC_1451 [Ignavibacteriota bacterium]